MGHLSFLKKFGGGEGGGNTRFHATHRKSGKALMNFFATQCPQYCHPAAVLHGVDGKLLGKQQRPTKPTRLTARNNTLNDNVIRTDHAHGGMLQHATVSVIGTNRRQ